MKIVCISDTHNQHEKLDLPEGDVLVHAGDWTGTGTTKQVINFIRWFSKQPHRYKVLIAGNHEITLDEESYKERWFWFHKTSPLPYHDIKNYVKRESGIYYLENEGVSIEGINFYGSPVTPYFGGWGFNVERGKPIEKVWKAIPTNTDVLITHGPPHGYGDNLNNDERAGCSDLTHEIETRINPKVLICGHIHSGYGQYVTKSGTVVLNAAQCDDGYIVKNKPLVYVI